MKAYVVHNLNGRRSGLVMAQNLKEAAKLLGVTVGSLNGFGYQIAKGDDLELAQANPGVVFDRKIGTNDPWEAKAPRQTS